MKNDEPAHDNEAPKDPSKRKSPFPAEWSSRWKDQLQGFKQKLAQNFNREKLQRSIQNFDPQAFSAWATQALQQRGTTVYGTLATIILSTWFFADLTSLVVGEYIPEPPPIRSVRSTRSSNRARSINDYAPIFSRNLFSSLGVIPGESANTGPSTPTTDLSGPAVKSTLPLNLIGTLILIDERRSIATIEDKGAGMVYPVRQDDEIPTKIQILKVEPRRVTFINLSSSRKEYIELPEDTNNTNPRLTPGKPTGPGIEKLSATQFNIAKNEVDRALADFNNILTQARAVPNFENGVAAGYKLFQIVPGSIYDKLGLQNGDVISGLNGSPINDPAKAFELLNELKAGATHLELQVKKDGKTLNYTYDIR